MKDCRKKLPYNQLSMVWTNTNTWIKKKNTKIVVKKNKNLYEFLFFVTNFKSQSQPSIKLIKLFISSSENNPSCPL